MDSKPTLNPNNLLKPLQGYIVEDLSNADTINSAKIVSSILNSLTAPVLNMMSGAGAEPDEIGVQFFPDLDDPSTPGNLLFWPTTRTSQNNAHADADQAEYSLRVSVFLSERDDYGVIYPAGFTLVLELEESACELVKQIPASIFETLEFQLKGSPPPAGFEFLDDSQHLPVMPNMRRQFLKAITRAHEVTNKGKRKSFEAVMLHYIWDMTEPEPHFHAVLSALATIFVAVHQQAKN